jgi:hypothetical protein
VDLAGEAVLALWNGVEASRAREYNAWHTREHVPERVGIPGMIGARRYVRLHGQLPEYLTLYSLATIDVLRSAAYLSLLDNPTPRSRGMRPSLRDFKRVGCRRVLSLGGGLGGSIMTLVLSEMNERLLAALKLELAELFTQQGLVAAHLLERDRNVADVPFKVTGERPDFAVEGIILLESYDPNELAALLPALGAALARLNLSATEQSLTAYRLAYAIDPASLEHVVALDQA